MLKLFQFVDDEKFLPWMQAGIPALAYGRPGKIIDLEYAEGRNFVWFQFTNAFNALPLSPLCIAQPESEVSE
jgi:hypothetical protein